MNDALCDDLSLQRQPFVLVSRVPAFLEKIGERNTTAVAFDDIEAAAAWVGRAEGAKRNIYVIRNHVRDGALYRRNKDGERVGPLKWGNPPLLEDIEAIEWFAIDIDPVDTRHEAARDHAIWALRRMPVPLYYIMDSGRGVQAAMRLAVPVSQREPDRYNSAIALAMRVQTWLKQVVDKTLVQVDNVANANRFSRLCGTINQKTGRRAGWIVPPDPKQTVAAVDGFLAGVEIPPIRKAGLVALPDGLDPFVAEAVRETGLKPSPRHMELLRGIVQQTKPRALSPEFAHRAQTGEDWAGRVHPDRSARIMSFASSAMSSGEDPAAVLQALLDPQNEVLNAHWLLPKQGRVPPQRAALRAIAKAIMALPLEEEDAR